MNKQAFLNTFAEFVGKELQNLLEYFNPILIAVGVNVTASEVE